MVKGEKRMPLNGLKLMVLALSANSYTCSNVWSVINDSMMYIKLRNLVKDALCAIKRFKTKDLLMYTLLNCCQFNFSLILAKLFDISRTRGYQGSPKNLQVPYNNN